MAASATQIAGRFGLYGGRYVPETLVAALDELEHAYAEAQADPDFHLKLDSLLRDYAGRPTPLYFAARLTESLGGAKIYLKREDLLHTGAHKINNCLGQALLAVRMGKKRIIAETGAGQHGVATATVCALFGLECVVYMGEEDMERQQLNVYRMRMLGAEVRGVSSGSRTLKDAINEAMRDWVTNVRTTHYLLGSVLGAHPYPTMVRDFHRVISREARAQILEKESRLPTAIIACVGGGSQRHWRVLRIHPRQGRAPHRRRSRRPQLAAWRTRCTIQRRHRPASCRAPIPTCCRTTTARSRSRIPFPPASTTPPSARNMPRCTIPAAPSTPPPPMPKPWMRPCASPAPKASSPRSKARTPSPNASALRRHMSPRDIVIVNVSGRGDKDMGILARELKLSGE